MFTASVGGMTAAVILNMDKEAKERVTARCSRRSVQTLMTRPTQLSVGEGVFD